MGFMEWILHANFTSGLIFSHIPPPFFFLLSIIKQETEAYHMLL